MTIDHDQDLLDFAEGKNDLYEWSDKFNAYVRKDILDATTIDIGNLPWYIFYNYGAGAVPLIIRELQEILDDFYGKMRP